VRLAAAIAAAGLLAGCAPQFDIGGGDWAKSGTQIQQTTLDEMECARLASRAYWTPDLFIGGLVDVARVYVEDAQMTTAFSRCMESKGYQTARRS
jgi:hypothetical protein